MRNDVLSSSSDHRREFADFEGVTYLNAAYHGPMPLVAARAGQEALEWKMHPYRLMHQAHFDLPDRLREKIARLIGAQSGEIAITTGASAGMASVAAGIDWQPGDQVLVAQREFPSHFSTWLRYEAAGKLRIRTIEPRGRFICAEDYVANIGPQTRVVSASLVRFDDGAMLDAAPVARACNKFGAAFLLDISQGCGVKDFRIRELGATMAVCSGYKWLLGPYGTGFFWAAEEWVDRLPLGSVYFMALQDARDFQKMWSGGLRPAPGARRWDAAETANFTNLAALDASLDLLLRIGAKALQNHVDALAAEIVERLPRERFALACPENPERRGPYVCIAPHDPNEIPALEEKLHAARVAVTVRNGGLRIAPYLYNTPADVARLIEVLSH